MFNCGFFFLNKMITQQIYVFIKKFTLVIASFDLAALASYISWWYDWAYWSSTLKMWASITFSPFSRFSRFLFSIASFMANMAAWSAASSTGISLANMPPILLNAGNCKPYFCSSRAMLVISSSVNLATPYKSCICGAMPSLNRYKLSACKQ